MYLMIDNYDSFVYNLKAYFQELGREILVKRCDEITLEDIEKMQPEGIILSPGPKRPWDAVLCVETVRQFQGQIPILGVCLGHQVLGHCCGATVKKGACPMHGKVTQIHHNGTGIFRGLPSDYKVTRYHSLVVEQDTYLLISFMQYALFSVLLQSGRSSPVTYVHTLSAPLPDGTARRKPAIFYEKFP